MVSSHEKRREFVKRFIGKNVEIVEYPFFPETVQGGCSYFPLPEYRIGILLRHEPVKKLFAILEAQKTLQRLKGYDLTYLEGGGQSAVGPFEEAIEALETLLKAL